MISDPVSTEKDQLHVSYNFPRALLANSTIFLLNFHIH
jgi:hypothetical protein